MTENQTKRAVDRRGFFREALTLLGAAKGNPDAGESSVGGATLWEPERRGPFPQSAGVQEVTKTVALLDRGLCLAWDDQPCQLCVIRCPRSGEALALEDFKPVVREENCAGCGECEQACSLMNGRMAAIRVKREGVRSGEVEKL